MGLRPLRVPRLKETARMSDIWGGRYFDRNVSKKFRNRGKTYFIDPAGTEVSAGKSKCGDFQRPYEIGDCVVCNHMGRMKRFSLRCLRRGERNRR